MVGLPEGATDGFELGGVTDGIEDLDGVIEGDSDGMILMLGDSEGIELGCEETVGAIVGIMLMLGVSEGAELGIELGADDGDDDIDGPMEGESVTWASNSKHSSTLSTPKGHSESLRLPELSPEQVIIASRSDAY